MTENADLTVSDIVSEAGPHGSDPGQATACMMVMMEIPDLREKAQRRDQSPFSAIFMT